MQKLKFGRPVSEKLFVRNNESSEEGSGNGMKRQRQDRRNILEAKSIGCHKVIIVPKPSNQIKAGKVIS